MSVKKKTVLLALMLAGVMGLSGCKTWDVVCDILAERQKWRRMTDRK